MTTAITTSNLSSGFLTFREILKSITTLTAAKAEFALDSHYFEFDPRTKSRNFAGYPFFLIETDMVDEPYTLNTNRQYNYGATISLFTEYHAKDNIKTYLDYIISWFNTNREVLLTSYNISTFHFTTSFDTEVIASELIAKGVIMIDFQGVL